jgi:hypothetical protein
VVLLHRLSDTPWSVYAKSPLPGPDALLAYLSRYLHRVGLDNGRLLEVTPHTVTLATRDDRAARLTPMEFIRRFLLHVLPNGFVKVRHYGLWASASREELWRAREALKAQGSSVQTKPVAARALEPVEARALTLEETPCPCCGAVDWLRHKLTGSLASFPRPRPAKGGPAP